MTNGRKTVTSGYKLMWRLHVLSGNGIGPVQKSPATTAGRLAITRSIRKNSVIYWTLQIVCWWLFFRAQSSGEVLVAGVSPDKAFKLWGVFCLCLFAFTHALRWSSKHWAWLDLPQSALFTRIVVGTLLIVLAAYLLLMALSLHFYGTPIVPLIHALYQKLPLRTQYADQGIFIALNILVWVAIYFAVVIQRHRRSAELRQAQLAEALQSAELRLLKSQLNPHFLFNALNSVRALIAVEPEKAQDAVTRLARALRYTLAAGEEDLVTLARELEMVDDYLGLESLRLADRLIVHRDIEPAALSARVPAMLVQTLVENAIKHGIAALKQGGDLHLTARRMESLLVIEVVNACPASATPTGTPEGIGLKNLSERLRLLFGPAATLSLDFSRSGEARVGVRLPA